METDRIQKLLFIYNADSGLQNQVIDVMHKIVDPGTYNCNLCGITFDAFTENKIWKRFRRETEFEMEFLHKDEFKKQYASKFGHRFTYPIILAASEKGLEVFVNTGELNVMTKAEELIALINRRVEI